MFWVSIANLVLTVILTGLAIFLTYWWSSYRRILPLELAKRHYKDVVKKGLCPKCGSKKIKFNPIIDSDGQTMFYTSVDEVVCNNCKNKWEREGNVKEKGEK